MGTAGEHLGIDPHVSMVFPDSLEMYGVIQKEFSITLEGIFYSLIKPQREAKCGLNK